MKKIIYFGLSFLSLFLLIACGKEEKKSSQENQKTQTQQQATVKQIAVGAEAPDFTLQSMDGKEVKLSDFKGKKVVVFCKKGDRAKMAEKELEKYGIKAFNAETLDKVKEVQVIDYKDKLSFRNDKPTFSYIKKGKKMKQVAVALGKGAVLEKHITDQQAVIVIVKGKIKFNISGKDIILKESDTYDIPINVEHELTGLDDENIFIITKGDWN